MKYIKTYEKDDDRKYKIGDYVSMNTNVPMFKTLTFGKIVDIGKTDGSSIRYNICKILLVNNEETCWTYEKYIVRKLNKKEILQFELELKSRIYNL